LSYTWANEHSANKGTMNSTSLIGFPVFISV